MTAPGDFPYRPRDRNPVFYGSFGWHSCVEMFWLLVRLLKTAPGDVPDTKIRAALDARLTPGGLRAEADFMATRTARRWSPYGWGWALALAAELESWDDPDARRWAAALRPLSVTLEQNFLRWLALATYPLRTGVHTNGSFGISRALQYADLQPDAELSRALRSVADRWFRADEDYPGGWEPSGHDFLSPALCEAELMARLLPREDYPAGSPASCPASPPASRPRCSLPRSSPTPPTARSPTCAASTSAAPGAGGASPRPCRPTIPA